MSRDPGLRGGWPTKLGDVMAPALERIGPKGLWTEARLRRAWPGVVGPDIAAHAGVRRLRGTTLEVWTDSDTWATELRYLSASVLERLNRVVGAGVVTEIVVRRTRLRDGAP